MIYGFGNKAYLSTIKDLYDGFIVAYQVSRNNDNLFGHENVRNRYRRNFGTRLWHKAFVFSLSP